MEEKRKRAYRYLLYHAMLDVRRSVWTPFGILNPFGWRRAVCRARRAGWIADWLHNLALFSVIELDRFDEERFWDDYRRVCDRYPDLTDYKDVFERELSGKGHIKGE